MQPARPDLSRATTAAYAFDSELQIWERPGSNADPVAYCDGEVEKILAAVVRNARDVSCGSDELAEHMQTWALRYHLSGQRADLLRPLQHLLKGHVLELGAGCGAITRYLGEFAQRVTAVEGSRQRAAIARSRCRDLHNVDMICDDLMAFGPDERFDAITLVGVLEYSSRFVDAPNPFKAVLQHVGTLVRPNGVVIIAIENQLGLKYFAGAAEDHNGVTFYGLHNRYEKRDAHTFGLAQLSDLLCDAGFEAPAALAAIPDYKLPSIIVSPLGARARSPILANLLSTAAAGDQDAAYIRTFSEELVGPELWQNGLLPELANSFLLVARPAGAPGRLQPCADASALAYTYSTSGRPRDFAKQTTLMDRGGGAIEVKRRRLYVPAVVQAREIRQVITNELAVEGTLYSQGLVKIVNGPGWRSDDIAAWAEPWRSFLLRHAKPGVTPDEALLPGHFLDCSPFNLIVDAHGALHAFDLEWQIAAPVAQDFVMFRGLCHMLRRLQSVVAPAPSTPLHVVSLATTVLRQLQIPLDRADIDALLQREFELFGTTAATMNHSCLRLRPHALLQTLRGNQQRERQLLQHNDAMRAKLARMHARAAEVDPVPRRYRVEADQAAFSPEEVDWLLGDAVDADYYLALYADVVSYEPGPKMHYVLYGAHEDRNPNCWFDTRHYKTAHPDVAADGINPLVHYLHFGWREGRSVAPESGADDCEDYWG